MGIIKRFASENYVAEQITTEINNTVVNFENTAGDLVSAHNVATDAHSDIREQISQLSSYVTPQMFGAKADGVTDDTKAVNDAIEAAGNNGIVFFPEGKYLVSSSMSASLGESERYIAIKIFEKENLKLLLSPKAHIKHKPFTEDEIKSANTTRHYIIGIIRSSNIRVTGGKIEGEADTHTYHTYQDDGTYSSTHGYGINIYSSNDIVVEDCEVFNCYGDGIHISIMSGYEKSNNITIDRCKVHDCIRLGFGICGADNTTIKNCEIYDISGASPQSGINFEPDYVQNMNTNSVVENCLIYNCANYAMVTAKANKGMKVRDCRLYGGVASTGDDTHPIEYINCDILNYQSSSAHRNILQNCRIASVGMYEMGDDFYDCTFNPDLFNHVIDGYGGTLASLLEGGSSVLENSLARFYRCEFVADNSGAYASNFMLWRNNGKIGSVLFDSCSFKLGLHSYQGFRVEALKDVGVVRCMFNTSEVTYPKQLIEFKAPNRLLFKDNIIDVKAITTYNGYSSIIRLYTKDTHIEGNQFLASKKVCSYPIAQTFIDNAGGVYVLRNYMPLWDTSGSYPTTATRFISDGNITSVIDEEGLVFTEEDKAKLDGINDIISNSGFITEVDAKAYTDSKVADVAAQASQQAPLFANTIDECTDDTKIYVLPDGNLYGCMKVVEEVVTKPNNVLPTAQKGSDQTIGWVEGSGYTKNARLSGSSGVVADEYTAVAGMCVSGYIPVKEGDVVRIKGFYPPSGVATYATVYNNMAIVKYNTFTPASSTSWASASWYTLDGTDLLETTVTFTLDSTNFSSGFNALRFSGIITEDTIVTINNEIKDIVTTTVTDKWTNTGHSFVAVLEDDIPVDVATEADISAHNTSPDAHSDIREMLANVEVSDEQIASAIADYIAKNPITGSSGRGIASIKRTSGTGAAGTTDTYTITYTDGTTSTFTVYNGSNGTNGKTAYESAKTGGYTGTESAFNTALANMASQTTETWTFTLEDGSTVTKRVVVV